MKAALTNSTRGRRNFLKMLMSLPAAAALPSVSFAKDTEDPARKNLSVVAATMGLISANVAAVMPETTEGPFYIDPKQVRSDITEGKPGIPLRMRMQVVTGDCIPVKSARADIWQCDAQGNYSAFSGQGSDKPSDTSAETFLRGTQLTDENGVVTFDTIYPGWYRGRTAHIHYKIFLDERTVLTSQIFFPDALSEYIYEKSPPYRRNQQRDTLNSIDGIAAQAGEGAYAAIREQKKRYIAALVVGIDPNATWTEKGPEGPRMSANGAPPPPGRRPGPPPDGPGGERGDPHGHRDESTKIFPG